MEKKKINKVQEYIHEQFNLKNDREFDIVIATIEEAEKECNAKLDEIRKLIECVGSHIILSRGKGDFRHDISFSEREYKELMKKLGVE